MGDFFWKLWSDNRTQCDDQSTATLKLTKDSSNVYVTVDTRVGAICPGSAGVDGLNWRFLGDHSAILRNASFIQHADLGAFADPTNPGETYPGPDYYPLGLPTRLIGFPQTPPPPLYFRQWQWVGGDLGPLDDAMAGLPRSKNLPELYALLHDPLVLPNLRNNHNTPAGTGSTLAFAPNLSLVDPIFNAHLMAPYYPQLPTSWRTMVDGHHVIDHLLHSSTPGAYLPPPTLWYYGDCDSVVPKSQPKLYEDKHLAIAPPVSSVLDMRIQVGEKHGWRDIDQELYEEYVHFFDDHLRNIKDIDYDNLADLLDTVSNDPDRDGDGQIDGNEWVDADDGANPQILDDPLRTFRITTIQKTIDNTTDEWLVKITFDGASSTATDYVLQSTNWLYADDLIFFPEWTDVPAAGLTFTAGTATSGIANHEFEFRLGFMNPSEDSHFYRIAIRRPGQSPNGAVTTAPVGIKKGTIKRRATESTENLICSPFMNPTVFQGQSSSSTFSSSTGLTTWAMKLAMGTSLPSITAQHSLMMGFTAPLTETGLYRYYAIALSDSNIVSNRPTPNLDDQGLAGHWWFLDSATTSDFTVVDRTNAITMAGDLEVGSSIAVRKLITVADMFRGLRAAPGSTNWWKNFDGTNGTMASPFRDGDIVRLLKRGKSDVDWTQFNSLLRSPLVEFVQLTFFETPNSDFGDWMDTTDPANPIGPVDLADFRLRPDEAAEYIAVAGSSSEVTSYWSSGHVSTSDVMAYVNRNPETLESNPPVGTSPMIVPWLPGDPNLDPSVDDGHAFYGLSIVGWPFPTDCGLMSADEHAPSSLFFESKLTNDTARGSNSGTALNPQIPASGKAGAVLFFNDFENAGFVSDSPEDATLVWGDYTGEFSYWQTPVPKIRFLVQGAIPFFGNNIIEPGGTAGTFSAKLRSGRGQILLVNRGEIADSEIIEWRMRRPYRRP